MSLATHPAGNMWPIEGPRASILTHVAIGMETLKKRVDRSSLPSQKVATTRGGIRNVSSELEAAEMKFTTTNVLETYCMGIGYGCHGNTQ